MAAMCPEHTFAGIITVILAGQFNHVFDISRSSYIRPLAHGSGKTVLAKHLKSVEVQDTQIAKAVLDASRGGL
jgi:hypothetical protein